MLLLMHLHEHRQHFRVSIYMAHKRFVYSSKLIMKGIKPLKYTKCTAASIYVHMPSRQVREHCVYIIYIYIFTRFLFILID